MMRMRIHQGQVVLGKVMRHKNIQFKSQEHGQPLTSKFNSVRSFVIHVLQMKNFEA